jgi:nicotinate-nucleotide adenylyltransferase
LARLVAGLGRRPRIGLLGGSFNPAHHGHRHISRIALDRLNLDRVWWLVSPQNPLKPSGGMAALDDRVAHARALARDPRILVTDIERTLGTRYSVDTVAALKRRFRQVRFVWLMGADNLIQLPQWRDWTRLVRSLPIAVLDRPDYASRALVSPAARRFAYGQLPTGAAQTLADRPPPAWCFLRIPLDWESATRLRQAGVWLGAGVPGRPRRPGMNHG